MAADLCLGLYWVDVGNDIKNAVSLLYLQKNDYLCTVSQTNGDR